MDFKNGTNPENSPKILIFPAEKQPSQLSIHTGLSLIFENMFANKGLAFVVIPSRISSIGKNAFAGNPLLSVTIGANVDVHDEAMPAILPKRTTATANKRGCIRGRM